jgi:hypothetical protein
MKITNLRNQDTEFSIRMPAFQGHSQSTFTLPPAVNIFSSFAISRTNGAGHYFAYVCETEPRNEKLLPGQQSAPVLDSLRRSVAFPAGQRHYLWSPNRIAQIRKQYSGARAAHRTAQAARGGSHLGHTACQMSLSTSAAPLSRQYL